MINSRSVYDLHPLVQDKAEEFIGRCAKAGIDVIITSTYRDSESQEALYAQGRTAPGKRVTGVRGGFSFHNWRVAFDYVPCINGKCVWDDDTLWTQCGLIAEGCGLEWGGRWVNFQDKPHCQYTGGLSIDDFRSGKTLS